MSKLKIWIVLIVTLVLAYFAPRESGEFRASEANELRVTEANKSNNFKASMPERLELLDPREPNQLELGELKVFSAKDSLVVNVGHTKRQLKKNDPKPVQQMQLAIAEVKTQVPPLPFKFLGAYTENNRQIFFLQHDSQNIALQVGETVQEKYRLESIEANTLIFTYLPMGIKQSLILPNHEKL